MLVFDGHNDTLLRLYVAELRGRPQSFFERTDARHIDLPRAREAGFGGGFFAVFVPARDAWRKSPAGEIKETEDGYEVPPIPPINPGYAKQFTTAVVARLFRMEAASDGQIRVVRTADELDACLERGILAVVLHFEGAETIDTDLDALYVFYEAGLRSLGIVWSRPNAFGHGVPFRFPASPDTGPGLTAAGRALVHACNRLGIVLDLSHLNEQGFWDVAGLSDAPLVVTHTAAHVLCASTRNLTDRQIDAVGASGGVVGLNFNVRDLRADGRMIEDTSLEEQVRHIDYMAGRIGIDHVALGSDFDGTLISSRLGDVTGLPRLLDLLRAHGYGEADLRKIARDNWRRVLRATWKAESGTRGEVRP